MKKKSKSVNIALSSSAFISVYPPASAVKKKITLTKTPESQDEQTDNQPP
jgi:hypothetical protein